jgi:two-component system cell cycle response regulator DivK
MRSVLSTYLLDALTLLIVNHDLALHGIVLFEITLRFTCYPMDILYVEDDDTNVFVMQNMLRTYSLLCVKTPEAALAAVNQYQFQLVLMDINLGREDCDGTDLMHRIKAQHQAYQRVPFFAVTAYAMGNDEAYYLRVGFDHYFPKPVPIAAFREAVRATLAVEQAP